VTQLDLAEGQIWSAATCRRFSASPVESGDKSPHSIDYTQSKSAIVDERNRLRQICWSFLEAGGDYDFHEIKR